MIRRPVFDVLPKDRSKHDEKSARGGGDADSQKGPSDCHASIITPSPGDPMQLRP